MEARRHRMSPVTPPTTSWKKRESRTDLSQPRHHHPALRTALLGDYGSDRRAAEPACQRHFEMTQGLPSGRHRSRGLKVSPHGRHWWRWLTDCHVGGVILPFARGCLRVGGTFRWVEDAPRRQRRSGGLSLRGWHCSRGSTSPASAAQFRPLDRRGGRAKGMFHVKRHSAPVARGAQPASMFHVKHFFSDETGS